MSFARRRGRLLVSISACVCALSLTGSSQAQQSIPLAVDRDEAHSAAIENALQSRFSVNYQDVTLQDVISSWRTQFGINIAIDEKYFLEESKVSLDSRLTLQLNDVRFESLLDTLADLLSLDYVVQADHLLITTPNGAEHRQQIRAYPVQDLVLNARGSLLPKERPFVIGVIPVVENGGPVKSTDRGRVFSDYDSLIETITSTIETASWEENGGSATVEPFPAAGCLMVSTTYRIHRRLEAYLAGLRAMRQSQVIESLPPNTPNIFKPAPKNVGPGIGPGIPVVGEKSESGSPAK